LPGKNGTVLYSSKQNCSFENFLEVCMPIKSTQLLQFSRQFKKFYTCQFTPFLDKTGLSMREVDVMLFLANNPDYDTARDVTEFRGLSKSQVSQAVDLLAAEGFLLRTPDLTDRRVIHLSITEIGAPLTKEILAIQSRCVQKLLAGLTEEQISQLSVTLETILSNGLRLAEEAAV
jgi:MarR family transcriptional regulator for hemolysin